MKHLKRFNEGIMTTIFLGVAATTALIYFILRLKSSMNQRSDTDNNIISRFKRAISRSPNIEATKEGKVYKCSLISDNLINLMNYRIIYYLYNQPLPILD